MGLVATLLIILVASTCVVEYDGVAVGYEGNTIH